jgi:DNA adenine methylase
MFLALLPQRGVLSDANEHLIHFYKHLREQPDLLHKYLLQFSACSSREYYYAIREQYNKERQSIKQAARFLYLNKHSYNGVFRVNTSGKYNVPFGERKNYLLPSKEHMRAAAQAFRDADLKICSYEQILPLIRPREFVYLDPPYPPLNGTANFTHYTPNRFSETDQHQLAEMVSDLDQRGVRFMMTNADVPLVRELYGQYVVNPLSVSRSVSCKNTRHSVWELVVTNYEIDPNPGQDD